MNVTTITCDFYDGAERMLTLWHLNNFQNQENIIIPNKTVGDAMILHGEPYQGGVFTTFRNQLTIMHFISDFHETVLTCGIGDNTTAARYPLKVFSKYSGILWGLTITLANICKN